MYVVGAEPGWAGPDWVCGEVGGSCGGRGCVFRLIFVVVVVGGTVLCGGLEELCLRWSLVVVVVGESAGLLCVMGETGQRMFVLVSPVSCGRFGGMFGGGREGEEGKGVMIKNKMVI